MQTFGLFVKHPMPGRVKTRLAAALGDEPACRVYTAFLTDLIEKFRSYPSQRCLGFSPETPEARRYFQALAGGDYRLWPQPSTDLGRRMFAFFSTHLPAPGDQAVLIGSDSPSLPTQFVAEAFEQLNTSEIVLGPAADGGYYLVGMNYPAKDIFADITWSEPTVLSETVKRIAAQNLKLSLLPVWYDVDSAADVQMLIGHLAAIRLTGSNHPLPATQAALNEIQADSRMADC